MTNKIKYVLLASLLLAVVGGFSYAKALTYSQIATPGKVLGDNINGFYPYPTGTLVNDSGTIFFISGTTKVPFTSWQAFVGLGYSSKNVVEGDLTNYTPAASYTINTPDAEHPWGSWLIYKGTVYYSTEGGLVGVPSSSVFISNGGDWTYIVKANKYDVAVLSQHPNLPVLTVDDTRVNSTPTYQFGNNPGNPTSSQISITAPASNFTQATVGTYYASSFKVFPERKSDGSQIQYTFSISGNMPPGFSSSTNYCPPNYSCAAVVINNVLTIYGTPTQAGTYTFNVKATDQAGISASVPFTLTVNNTAVGSPILTTTLNSAFTGGSVSAGTVSQKIGSYSLTASPTQAVNLTSMSITAQPQGGQAAFQNLVVKANGIQFGQTQGTVASAYVYLFNGTVNIPANGTVIFDVYADVLSTANAALNPATAISGCTAFGATDSLAANCSPINGQNISLGSQTSGARVGQLVNINSTVYYVGSNGLYGIPSLDVFSSWGWSFANVLPANSIEQSLSQAGIVPLKQAGCNSPIDQINGTCTTIGSSSINVTAPTAGSLLIPGQTYNITWNSTGIQTVKLQLCATSQTLGYICMAISGPSTNYNASLGSYSFYIDPNAPFVGNVVSSGVKIRITDIASGVYGESAPFSIAAAGSSASPITVTSPSGGTYSVGSSLVINWTSADYGLNGTKHVDINLLTYDPNLPNRNVVATIASYIFKTGSYSWTIPSSVLPGQYIVSVSNSETGTASIADHGLSQPFTIAQASNNTQLNFTVNAAASPVAATVAPGTSSVVFSVWDITAVGGNGSLSAISIGSDSPNAQSNLSNIRIYQGTNLLGIVGSLANITSVNGFAQAWGSVSFSNLSIPVNGVVTLRVLADVLPSATGSTKLGIIGLGFGTTGSATTNLTSSYMAFGNAMTFGSASTGSVILSATPNPTFTALNITQGLAGQKIASYIIKNPSSQPVSLSSIYFEIDSAVFGGQTLFLNITVKANDVQFGQTLGSLSSIGGYYFTANAPVTIPANIAITVDMYADVPINASAPSYINTATLLANCSGSGLNTTSQGGCTVANGQSLTLNGQTATTLTASLSVASPVSQSVVGGNTNQAIATYNIMASGGSATIQELDFAVVGGTNMPITTVSAGGLSATIVGSTAMITGLNISVPTNYNISIPVTVNYTPVGINGVPAGQQFTLNLTKIKFHDNGGYGNTATFNVASNQMTLVAGQ